MDGYQPFSVAHSNIKPRDPCDCPLCGIEAQGMSRTVHSDGGSYVTRKAKETIGIRSRHSNHFFRSPDRIAGDMGVPHHRAYEILPKLSPSTMSERQYGQQKDAWVIPAADRLTEYDRKDYGSVAAAKSRHNSVGRGGGSPGEEVLVVVDGKLRRVFLSGENQHSQDNGRTAAVERYSEYSSIRNAGLIDSPRSPPSVESSTSRSPKKIRRSGREKTRKRDQSTGKDNGKYSRLSPTTNGKYGKGNNSPRQDRVSKRQPFEDFSLSSGSSGSSDTRVPSGKSEERRARGDREKMKQQGLRGHEENYSHPAKGRRRDDSSDSSGVSPMRSPGNEPYSRRSRSQRRKEKKTLSATPERIERNGRRRDSSLSASSGDWDSQNDEIPNANFTKRPKQRDCVGQPRALPQSTKRNGVKKNTPTATPSHLIPITSVHTYAPQSSPGPNASNQSNTPTGRPRLPSTSPSLLGYSPAKVAPTGVTTASFLPNHSGSSFGVTPSLNMPQSAHGSEQDHESIPRLPYIMKGDGPCILEPAHSFFWGGGKRSTAVGSEVLYMGQRNSRLREPGATSTTTGTQTATNDDKTPPAADGESKESTIVVEMDAAETVTAGTQVPKIIRTLSKRSFRSSGSGEVSDADVDAAALRVLEALARCLGENGNPLSQVRRAGAAKTFADLGAGSNEAEPVLVRAAERWRESRRLPEGMTMDDVPPHMLHYFQQRFPRSAAGQRSGPLESATVVRGTHAVDGDAPRYDKACSTSPEEIDAECRAAEEAAWKSVLTELVAIRDAKRNQDREARRQSEEEARRREEEEEALRRSESIRRKEEELRRQEEAIRRQAEEVRRHEEEVRRREEEIRQRESAAEAEAKRRRIEEERQKRLAEEEQRRRQAEEEERERRAEEMRRQQQRQQAEREEQERREREAEAYRAKKAQEAIEAAAALFMQQQQEAMGSLVDLEENSRSNIHMQEAVEWQRALGLERAWREELLRRDQAREAWEEEQSAMAAAEEEMRRQSITARRRSKVKGTVRESRLIPKQLISVTDDGTGSKVRLIGDPHVDAIESRIRERRRQDSARQRRSIEALENHVSSQSNRSGLGSAPRRSPSVGVSPHAQRRASQSPRRASPSLSGTPGAAVARQRRSKGGHESPPRPMSGAAGANDIDLEAGLQGKAIAQRRRSSFASQRSISGVGGIEYSAPATPRSNAERPRSSRPISAIIDDYMNQIAADPDF